MSRVWTWTCCFLWWPLATGGCRAKIKLKVPFDSRTSPVSSAQLPRGTVQTENLVTAAGGPAGQRWPDPENPLRDWPWPAPVSENHWHRRPCCLEFDFFGNLPRAGHLSVKKRARTVANRPRRGEGAPATLPHQDCRPSGQACELRRLLTR